MSESVLSSGQRICHVFTRLFTRIPLGTFSILLKWEEHRESTQGCSKCLVRNITKDWPQQVDDLYLGTFGASIFNHFFNYFVWLRITDESSVPEMRIWSILEIKSDLKWCIDLSRSLFLYFNYLVSVTAGGPRSPRGHM